MRTLDSARSVTVCMDEPNGYAKLCKITWSKSDASLYVIPYSTKLPPFGHVGVIEDLGPQESRTFDYSKQGTGTAPKLSIHESGQTHAQCVGYQTRPLRAARLDDPRGGHIATMTCFNRNGLPRLTRSPRLGRDPDVVIPRLNAPNTAVHVRLFAVSEVPRRPGSFSVTLRRPGLTRPLHIQITPRASADLKSDGPGMLIVSGWGAGASTTETASAVYVVTK